MTDVLVKDPSSQFDSKRLEARHIKSGEQVYNPIARRMCELPSEQEDAKAGVFLKFLAHRSGLVQSPLTEFESQLKDEMSCGSWIGKDGETFVGTKALLDDSGSGGQEVVPAWFDAALIDTPLVTGELFPRVDLREVPRGSSVEAASIGTPTMSWGQGDGTTVSLFDTSNFIAAINTTIFGVACAIELGRDFISDAAVSDIGARVTTEIGKRFAAELDKVIATGDGTTQPQGLTNASGLSSVSSTNGATGPWDLADVMNLYFGVSKAYRVPAYRPVYISNDTSYARWRAIKVDPAVTSTDQRPVLAPLSEVGSYRSLELPHLVQADIGNQVAFFGAMARYRLYRRAGLSIQYVDGGSTLARANKVLLIARARFGGQVMDASAFAKISDGQS